MSDLAVGLYRGGRYRDAERLDRETLNFRTEALGSRDPQTLASMNNLALVLQSEGQFAESESLYRQALEAELQVEGQRSQDALVTRNNLANLLANEGKYDQAESLQRETLALRQRLLGRKHADTLNSMANLTVILQFEGRFLDAEKLGRQTLDLEREVLGPRNSETLAMMSTLSTIIGDEAHYHEAELLGRQTLDLQTHELGERNPATLNTMNSIGGLMEAQGRYGEAEVLYRKTLAIRNGLFGSTNPDTLTSMNNLAFNLESQGRLSEAEPLYRSVLAVRQAGSDQDGFDALISMDNLGALLTREGKFQEAETLLRQAFEGFRRRARPNSPMTLTSMGLLATLLVSEGELDEAERLSRQTLDLEIRLNGPKSTETITAMTNLAFVLTSQRKYPESIKLNRDALTLCLAEYGPDNPETLTVQINLTVALAAEDHILDAASLQERIGGAAIDWIGTQFYSTPSTAGRHRLGFSPALYQDVVLTLAQIPNVGKTGAEAAALALLKFKGFAADEEAYLSRLASLKDGTRLASVATEIHNLHAEIVAAYQQSSNSRDMPTLLSRLDERQAELGSLSRRYADALQVRDVTLPKVQHALEGRSGLLELRQYNKMDFKTGRFGSPGWAGILITGSGDILVRDLGQRVHTAESVEAFLNGSSKAADGEATSLYKQFLKPFAAELEPLDRLYVSPDGILNLLPFGLLRTAEGERVIDRWDVRILQTGRDLIRRDNDNINTAKGLIAVGDIDYNSTSIPDYGRNHPSQDGTPFPSAIGDERSLTLAAFRSGFSRLPYTSDEIHEISDLYDERFGSGSARIVEGNVPTKTWLMAQPAPRVLHLATHGFYRSGDKPSDQPMLLAGIALAGANGAFRGNGDGGILYALEAQDLNLRGTELVVLSACQTALGQFDYGDGMSSLVRAFRVSGARNILVTLRPVSDREADKFMQRFYFHWLSQKHSDPAAALRETQLEYSLKVDGDRNWMSFMIVGK